MRIDIHDMRIRGGILAGPHAVEGQGKGYGIAVSAIMAMCGTKRLDEYDARPCHAFALRSGFGYYCRGDGAAQGVELQIT
jgi:hypothetical protein